jgi:anti-sigma B factor antagonist
MCRVITIERMEIGAVTVLRLVGDIDEDGMNDLRLALTGCIRDRRCNMVVNLSEVSFISYMGVGVLVERLRQLRAYGGDMRLACLNLYTDRLFRMVGVSKVFQVFESESQAIQTYREAA